MSALEDIVLEQGPLRFERVDDGDQVHFTATMAVRIRPKLADERSPEPPAGWPVWWRHPEEDEPSWWANSRGRGYFSPLDSDVFNRLEHRPFSQPLWREMPGAQPAAIAGGHA